MPLYHKIHLTHLFRENKILPIPPLKNLQFYVCNNKEQVKNRILRLGGLVLSKTNVPETTAAAIGTPKDVEKMKRGTFSTAFYLIRDTDIEVCNHNNDVDLGKRNLNLDKV